ncbi:MAG: hypothetical protein ACLP2Y_13240 [Limisphaerales bacterium]
MRTQNLPKPLLMIAAVTVTCLFARDVMAQGSSDVATIPNVAPTAAPAGDTTVQLSYGVSQIIQLSQAKVSDDTIANYIRNSGSSYGLDASQIVYLKQQGVSDTVINTMLNQPRPVAPVAPQPAYPPASSTATYVQPAPAYVPPSTVYVIPNTQAYQYYNNYYYPACGYYPYYGGCYYPAVSFAFGFGGYRGGYYHGGWYGGYRGSYRGGYRGGGWHR